MGAILEDIKTGANKIVQLFALEKINMEYSIRSLIEIDRFFNKHSRNSKGIEKGFFTEQLGVKLFCFGAYVGETIIKNVSGSIWIPDVENPEKEVNVSIKLPNGDSIWPVQKVIKRFNEGNSESVYVYGYHVTKSYLNEPFDDKFWDIEKETNPIKKPWWKF